MSLLRRRGAHEDPTATSEGTATSAGPAWALLATPEPDERAAAVGSSDGPQVGAAGSGYDSAAEELLAHPAVDDDLGRLLTSRPRRAKLATSTSLLSAAALVVVGFAGGVIVQRHETSGSGLSNAAFAGRSAAAGRGGATGAAGANGSASAAAGSGSAAPGAGGGFGRFGAGGATVGTVKLVDGTTLYVQTTGGGITKVSTDPATTIRITKDGTLKDLAPGTTVVVVGTAGSDGTVTARTVTEGGLGGGRGQTGG